MAAFCITLLAGGSATAQIKAGFLGELTGKSSSLMAPCMEGIKLASETIREKDPDITKKLDLIYADTQDDAKTAVSEFRKLAEHDKVSAVVVTRSKTALPVKPLSASLGIPVVALSAHPQLLEGNPYVFRLYPTAQSEGALLADAIIRSGVKRLAIITAEDEWTTAFSEAVSEKVQSRGIEVVSNQMIGGDVTDFSSYVLRIRREKPDGIFVNSLLAQAAGIVKKLRESKLNATLYSNHWIQYPEVLAVAGKEALEGLVFVEVDYEQPQFLNQFSRYYPDRRPASVHYLCYLAAGMLYETAMQIKGEVTSQNFKEALKSKRELSLNGAPLAIVGREAQIPSRLRILKDGGPVPVSSAFEKEFH